MEDPSPGQMLRAARLNARLSQTDLARQVNVAQSMISAYEADRREPSLSTLKRLISATGNRLVIEVQEESDGHRGLPNSVLGRRLRRRRRAVLGCASRHGASNVRVFGSVARGEDGPGSDIDLVVDTQPGTGLFKLESLRSELSELLRTRVDVIPFDSVRASVRREIERDAVSL